MNKAVLGIDVGSKGFLALSVNDSWEYYAISEYDLLGLANIISKTKSYEEKEFYLKLASKEKYKAKELVRQIDSGYYERLLLSNGKAPSAIESKDMTGVLRDMYMLEFLDLSEPYEEYDLKKAILKNMKNFQIRALAVSAVISIATLVILINKGF